MEAGVVWEVYWDPSIQIAPTLHPKVYKYDLHGATWSLRERLPGFRI